MSYYIHEKYLFQSIDGVYLQRQIVGDFSLFMGKIYNKKLLFILILIFKALKLN